MLAIQRLRERTQQGARAPAHLPGCLQGPHAHLADREHATIRPGPTARKTKWRFRRLQAAQEAEEEDRVEDA